MSELTPRIVTGTPGVKANPRADFVADMFDQQIVTKGNRVYWSRAGVCPCLANGQTEQPDPNCVLCRGRAWFYYLPDPALVRGAQADAFGNPVLLNTVGDGVMIFAVMSSLSADVQVFEKFGEWVFGTSRATTQAQNRLGYRDRLVSVDATIPWAQIVVLSGSQTIQVVGGDSKTGLRYPLVDVHMLRTLTTLYRRDVEWRLTTAGEIEWLITPPTPGTRLSIAGMVHPVWIVIEQVNAARDTLTSFKTKTKDEEPKHLPGQVLVKLDFLVPAP